MAGQSIEGTAADTWKTGPAGLGTLPTAAPDGFDQALLDRAVEQTQAILVTGNLDERLLYERETTEHVAAYDERTRPAITKALQPGAEHPYQFASRFAEGTRADGPVRASGVWTAERREDAGTPYLAVEWRGTFVHPVTDGKRRTVVPVYRKIEARWWDSTSEPGLNVRVRLSENVDACATARSGLITPDYEAAGLAGALADPLGERASKNEDVLPDC